MDYGIVILLDGLWLPRTVDVICCDLRTSDNMGGMKGNAVFCCTIYKWWTHQCYVSITLGITVALTGKSQGVRDFSNFRCGSKDLILSKSLWDWLLRFHWPIKPMTSPGYVIYPVSYFCGVAIRADCMNNGLHAELMIKCATYTRTLRQNRYIVHACVITSTSSYGMQLLFHVLGPRFCCHVIGNHQNDCRLFIH